MLLTKGQSVVGLAVGVVVGTAVLVEECGAAAEVMEGVIEGPVEDVGIGAEELEQHTNQHLENLA